MKTLPTVYCEIAPLTETRWTGIPMVAAQLVRELLGCRDVDPRFFLNNQLIKPDRVERCLRMESGAYLRADIAQGLCQDGFLPIRFKDNDVGLWPNVKTYLRRFPREGQIIHDVSTLLTPQFHTPENIRNHTHLLRAEMQSNDRTFCVSEATRDDLVHYLGVPREKTAVTPLGTSWPEDFYTRAQVEVDWLKVEPYVVCIGTLEPRKNLKLVFDFLSRHLWLLQKMRFVFVGRKGWLMEMSDLKKRLADQADAAVIERNLVFTDYIDRYTLFALLRKAQFSIYPSCFEGFGLPVIEALSVGCPVLSSYSSSLPEVGGNDCEYFDPYSLDDFTQAFWRMLRAIGDKPEALRAAAQARAAQFGWKRFFDPYRDWALEHRAPTSAAA